MERLPKDFVEFLKALSARGAEYVIVGGHAVAFHGYPRYTGDLDVWIAISDANSERIVQALKDFGFDLPELSKEMFLDPARMTRMGREPLRIEILNSISGDLNFDQVANRAVKVELDEGFVAPFICFDDLIVNKKASGRTKDILDLENLPGSDG